MAEPEAFSMRKIVTMATTCLELRTLVRKPQIFIYVG